MTRFVFTARILTDGEAVTIARAGCQLKKLDLEDFREDAPHLQKLAWRNVPPLCDVDMVVAFWDGESIETSVILDDAKDGNLTAWVIRPDGTRYRYS